MSTTTTEPTLHQALEAVGWRSEPRPDGGSGRLVFDDAGQLVSTDPSGAMTAGAVWRALRERGLVLP